YVPHIGLFIMVIFGTAETIGHRASRRIAVAILAAAATAACLVLTHVQVGYWMTSETLWQHTLACDPDNWLAHYSIGATRHQQGKIGEAVEHYRSAIRSRPDHSTAH